MIPPPPRSPLFPYTTLFRSRRTDMGARSRGLLKHAGHVALRHEPDRYASDLFQRLDIDNGDVIGDGVRHVGCLADRKSTRLNSSHMSISYAVFCLKKKIQYN